MDLFVVPTISFQLLYGLLILQHGRREILWLGATTHPSAEWISRQLMEAYGWEQGPRYLVRDRDSVYCEVFIRRLRAMGIRDRPTAPRSPWQNGDCERLIGSIRRECLDHVVVFGERHLRHLLRSYANYYNQIRTHLSLNKDAPVSRAIQSVGHIFPTPILDGLHHRYVRIQFPTRTAGKRGRLYGNFVKADVRLIVRHGHSPHAPIISISERGTIAEFRSLTSRSSVCPALFWEPAAARISDGRR